MTSTSNRSFGTEYIVHMQVTQTAQAHSVRMSYLFFFFFLLFLFFLFFVFFVLLFMQTFSEYTVGIILLLHNDRLSEA